MSTKRLGILSLILLLIVTVGCTMVVRPVEEGSAASPAMADSFALPVGFRPEGIAIGADGTIFVGSLGTIAAAGDPIVGGAIYRGNLNSGEGTLIVEPAAGQMAVGLHLDPRTNILFVAGGLFGDVRAYDGASGALLARYAVGGEGSFINDLTLTSSGVYATDSFLPFLYHIPLTAEGALIAETSGEQIALAGDYMAGDGSYPFQANGIVASSDGQSLIIVNSNTGLLYRVEPATGVATAIDLAGESVGFGDGLVLDGATLYVVENYANQIAVVTMAPDLLTGSIDRLITQSDYAFNIPTTAAQFHEALYVVNGRFDDAAPLTAGTPDIAYAILRVPVALE